MQVGQFVVLWKAIIRRNSISAYNASSCVISLVENLLMINFESLITIKPKPHYPLPLPPATDRCANCRNQSRAWSRRVCVMAPCRTHHIPTPDRRGSLERVANVYGNGTKTYVMAHLCARVRALCTVVKMHQHMSLQNLGQSKLHALLGLGAPPRNVVPAVQCSRDSEL